MCFVSVAQVAAAANNGLTGIAAIIAAVVAWKGLQTWKRQLLGNANYDLSRRLLRATYRLREAIRWVRNPYMSVGEMDSAMKAAGLEDSSPNRPDDRAGDLAYQARWRKVVDAQLEFAAEILEAEVLWGPEVRQRAETLASAIGELHFALSRYLSRRQRPLDAATDAKITGIIYEGGEESTAFSDRLKAAFEGIEAEIRPHLKLR